MDSRSLQPSNAARRYWGVASGTRSGLTLGARRRGTRRQPSRLLIIALVLTTAFPVHDFGVATAQEVHPLVPPLACCEPECKVCPSAAARCVPAPYVAIINSHLATDPISGPRQQLTVHEAIRIAMSNSEVVRNLGLVDAQSDVDIVRGQITVYDPRAAWAAAAGEWGIFDPMWTTEMQWERIDIPPGTSFGGIGERPPELDTADFYTSIDQLLPLGTRFRTEYVTDYLFNPDHPVGLDPNPQYFSYVQFGVNQPLMQGLGVNVTMAPIRIAAAEAERTDWQFKQEVLALVRSVETAYWTLYAEQQNLRALDQALPLFREIVRVREEQARGAAGTESEAARALSELLLYEQRRLDAMSNIAEQQLVLRNLLGLPTSDGRYFSLVALPITTPPFETVGDAIMTAVNMRPDVLRQRIAVYVAQQERVVARDSFRPKFDFNAFWRINGLGEDLGESLDVIGDNDYHDWQLGLRFQVPLGRRQGRANIRAAELIIQRERALLDQAAHQASFEVADAYRRIIWLHQQYRVSSSRVDALMRWREGAQAQFEHPPPGVSTVLALELYLNNLRDFVEASIKANAILANFNSALARLEEVKGTLLETRLVEVVGDETETLPEELPAPVIQLPDWMTPPASEVEGPAPAPGTGSSIETFAPITAAPVAPTPALVNPETAGMPLAVPAAPALRAPEAAANVAPQVAARPAAPQVKQPESVATDRYQAAPALPINAKPRNNSPYAKLFENTEALPVQAPAMASRSPAMSAPAPRVELPNTDTVTENSPPTPAPLATPAETAIVDQPLPKLVEPAPLPTRMRGALENFISAVNPERSEQSGLRPRPESGSRATRLADEISWARTPGLATPPLLEQVELYTLRLESSEPQPFERPGPRRNASEVTVTDVPAAADRVTNPRIGGRSMLINPEAERVGSLQRTVSKQRFSNTTPLVNPAEIDGHEPFVIVATDQDAPAELQPAESVRSRNGDARHEFSAAGQLVNPEALRPMRRVPRPADRVPASPLAYPASIGAVGQVREPQAATRGAAAEPLVNPAGYVVTDLATPVVRK